MRNFSTGRGANVGLTTLLGWLVIVTSSSRLMGDAASGARGVLMQNGLSASGDFWLASQEIQLRRQIAGLDALDRRHRQAQQQATAMLEKNEQIRARLVAAEAAKKSGKAPASSSGSSTSGSTDAKKGPELNSKLADVTGIGEMTPLQTAMIELVAARQAVLLACAQIDRAIAELPEKYGELAKQEAITTALKDAGESQRLGPTKDYRRDGEKARQMASIAQRGPIPVFQECGQFRLGAIINEDFPLTMTISAEKEPTLITSTAGQSMGLTPQPDAMKRDYRRGDRTVKVTEVSIPSVRLGAIILRDVSALLLPPEAEDLASQLAIRSIEGYRTELVERRMALAIEPTGDAASR